MNDASKHRSPRPRVLLLAYACHPERGSEPGVGWNRAVLTAQHFDTWVVCEGNMSGNAIRRYLAEHGVVPGLQFHFVSLTAWQELLRRIPAIGYLLAYNLWHRRALNAAQQLHRQVRFDLVHQVNICSFREPGYLWKLDVPFVWGPVGGTQNYPWPFLAHAGLHGAVSESIRNVLNSLQLRFSPRVRLAVRRAALLLAANSTNQSDIFRTHGVRPVLMLETGVCEEVYSRPKSVRVRRGPLRILWSGVFQHRKALHLLLEALKDLPPPVEFELRILGEGALEKRWKRLARRVGVDHRCQWLGWLPHREALQQYQWADVLVFTSMRDTSGNVVLEALASGTPVVCLDHQGVRDIVTPECGIKIPVATPRKAVSGLRSAICELYHHRDRLSQMGVAARRRAGEFLWRHQGKPMAELYREVLGRPDQDEVQREERPRAAAAGVRSGAVGEPEGVGG